MESSALTIRLDHALLRQFDLAPQGYVLFVARLVPEKRAQDLIRAFRALATPLRLAIVGDSSHTDAYVAALRRLARGDARIVFRLSGTGTSGATVRVYIEAVETDLLRQRKDAQELLAPLIAGADELARIRKHLKIERPTVIT